METIIKDQKTLNKVINKIVMIGNIYFDENMNYVPINWDKEFIRITNINNITTIDRVKY